MSDCLDRRVFGQHVDAVVGVNAEVGNFEGQNCTSLLVFIVHDACVCLPDGFLQVDLNQSVQFFRHEVQTAVCDQYVSTHVVMTLDICRLDAVAKVHQQPAIFHQTGVVRVGHDDLVAVDLSIRPDATLLAFVDMTVFRLAAPPADLVVASEHEVIVVDLVH